MWNYTFVIPDLVILFVLLIYYFASSRIPIKINRAFIRLVVVDAGVALFDFTASYALEFLPQLSSFCLRCLNVVFFVFFLFRIYLFFKFTESIINVKRKKVFLEKFLENGIVIFSICIVILNLFFNTFFEISSDKLYSRAKFYNICYICSFYYLALSFVDIFLNRKKLSKTSFTALVSFNSVLVIGYVFRILLPAYLILNFFTLISIMMIFVCYENPVFYLAGKANAFNKKALYALLSEVKENEKPLVIGFIINNYNELREIYSSNQMDIGISLICQFLAKNYPKCLRFYLHDGRFILFGKDNSLNDKIIKEISERFMSPWQAGKDVDIYLEPKFVQTDSSVDFSDTSKIGGAIFTAFREAESFDSVNICINNETIAGIDKNTGIKRAMESAVENNTVEMFLQPLINSKNNSLIGAEALARIRDENGELIPPGLFIPLAEKNGRISQMGEQIFEKACQFIQNYNIEKMGLSWINVNLSPIQFLRSDLNQRFFEILKKYNVDAGKIHLEITEESMIDYAVLQKQIQTMRNTGFQFVLDDYGSGYSNISRLKRCPFINIKLDMEIVRDYFKDRDTLVPALVQAFKKMNFSITAEGVETLEMAEVMRDIGCDYLQGYYFSKPLSVEEFVKKYDIN